MTNSSLSPTAQQDAAAALRAREAAALLFLALLTLSLDGPVDRLVWPVRFAAAALCLVATLDALRLRASRVSGERPALTDTAQKAAWVRPSGPQRPLSDDRAVAAAEPNGAAWNSALVPSVQPVFAPTSSPVHGTWMPPEPPAVRPGPIPVWAQIEVTHPAVRPPVVQGRPEDWPGLDLPGNWQSRTDPDDTGLLIERPGLDDLWLFRAGETPPRADRATPCVFWSAGPDLPPEPTTTGWTVSGSPRHLVSVLEVL